LTAHGAGGPASAGDHGDQRRRRRQGSLAAEVPRTPTSSLSGDTLSTSPDTGIAPGNGVGLAAVPHGSGDHLARRAAQRVVDPETGHAPTVSSSLQEKAALPQALPRLGVVALEVPARLSPHDLGRDTA